MINDGEKFPYAKSNEDFDRDLRAVVQGMAAHGSFPARAQPEGINDALNTAAIVAGWMQAKREKRYRMQAEPKGPVVEWSIDALLDERARLMRELAEAKGT